MFTAVYPIRGFVSSIASTATIRSIPFLMELAALIPSFPWVKLGSDKRGAMSVYPPTNSVDDQ